jgi:riboflavin kinase/FMN adenylyltransferase
MRLFSSLDSTTANGAWLTIGSFDGVHKGHQEIIRSVVTGAHRHAAPAVVLTFYPHPSIVLRGSNGPFYLTSLDDRANLIGDLGVDIVIIHRFDRQLADTSAQDFMVRLKERLGLRKLLVGNDFTLGRGREGDVNILSCLGEELGFEVIVNPPVFLDGQVISSSQIRAAISAGDVIKAYRLLGRPYQITGDVIPGDGRGRAIGIPTANLHVWSEQLLPATGVYACQACVSGKYYLAATNIGIRPTFNGSSPTLWVETHLLDFNGDLYDHKIHINFLQRLRGERKFPNIQSLVAQIQLDIAQTRVLLTQPYPK